MFSDTLGCVCMIIIIIITMYRVINRMHASAGDSIFARQASRSAGGKCCGNELPRVGGNSLSFHVLYNKFVVGY